MADTNTTNLSLVKPEVGASSDTWGTKLNNDLDTIDALFDAGPVLKLAKGGTGAATAAGARTNLGLGSIATQDAASPSLGAVSATSVAATGDVTSSGGKGGFQTVESEGQIWAKATGYKFPDGTTQTTAAGASAGTAFTNRSASVTVASNTRNRITANSVVITLPASPSDGDWVDIIGQGVTGCSVGRNGKNLLGAAENLDLDTDLFAIRLVYISADTGWRIAP